MNVSGVDYESVIDGIGFRVTIFVSGCSHHCKGCHNPDTWCSNYGVGFTDFIQEGIFKACELDYIDGITLSGGCPMCNAKSLLPFVRKFKKRFPDKTIWCYCGELYEDIIKDKKDDKYKLLKLVDVLVDGEFVLKLRDTTLPFKGSSNQRLIDVKESMKKKEIVRLEIDI
jgi:anaerobic ribonucleoside-triphosphate reductase activating protein